ncbi:MAG: MFS transporter, partial [Anaerovoracaceae bacterium]
MFKPNKICSYSLGYMGQGAAYNFMSTYFIVFMTDCVGLSSSLSASIMSIALLIEVISGMAVGNISDNCSSKIGKRRPFILFACLTLPPIILLLFMPIDAGGSFK